MVNPSDIVRKAEELAKKNPDKARSLIDALEDRVDKVTGGKYAGHVDRAGDFVEGRLGLGSPDQRTADPQAPAAEPADQAQPPAGRARPPAAGAAPAEADPAQAQADESVQG